MIEDKLSHLRYENLRLTGENKELNKRVTALERKIDDAEQDSRRNCLRISNLTKNEDENTDETVVKVANMINVELTLEEIDRSHRTGKRSEICHPDIIVKLSTYRVRDNFFRRINFQIIMGSS